MSDYSELIDRLHEGAEFLECSTPGLRNSFAKMLHNAAEAIDELNKENESLASSVIAAAEILRNRRGELDKLQEVFCRTTNYGRIIHRTPEAMAELLTAIISERDKTWMEKLAAAGIEAEIIEMPVKSVANHLAWLCEEAEE